MTDEAESAPGRPRLSAAVLAVQSAVSEEEIATLVRVRLISGADARGTFDPGNVTRIRLIKALEDSGIELETLARAGREKGLSFDFASQIVAEPVGLAPLSVEQACYELGIEADEFREIMLTAGIATPAPDAAIREDDLELLRIVASAGAYGLPKPAVLSVIRAIAISMRAVAEAERELFRKQVEEAALARGVPYHEMFAATAAARIPLQRLGYRLTFLLQRRLLEQLVYENLVSRFEEALDERDIGRSGRAIKQAIVFVDLSGFTERTENRGDLDAARIGSTLVEIAQTEATVHRGNLVKPLGDGAMLRFAQAGDAVRGALSMLTRVRQRALPPARAGVALGPLIMQDGDFYGRTVNRASRLLGVASPDQVLVTAEVAGSVRDARLRFNDLGIVRLKGVAEDVRAFAAASAAAQ